MGGEGYLPPAGGMPLPVRETLEQQGMSGHVDRAATAAKGAAGKAGDHPVVEWGARLGYAASGVLHLLLAWLPVNVALGDAHGQASQSGALATVAHQSFGLVLLWVLAL